MSLKAMIAIAAVVAWPSVGAVDASGHAPDGPTDLALALKGAASGDEIRLAPGTYKIAITGSNKRVVIKSADPDHPSTVTSLLVRGSSGLTFSGIDFDASTVAVGPNGGIATNAFEVFLSGDIHFDHDRFHGSSSGVLGNTVSGLAFRADHDVTVTDSDFYHLHNGVQHLEVTRLEVSRNNFHDLYDDGIRGGGSSWVTIDSNHCYSNHPDAADLDHPDCIQFWQDNEKAPSHDISITNNRYERGTGHPTQGIFVEGAPFPNINVTITGNIILGGMWNGIAVSGAQNLVIADNIVSPGCKVDQGISQSWIRVGNNTGVTIKGNRAFMFLIDGKNVEGAPPGNKTAKCAS